MAGHHASADVGCLLKQANLVLNRSGTRTVLRVADGHAATPRETNSDARDLVLRAKVLNLDASDGTGGQLVPQRSHSREEDLILAAKSLSGPRQG